MTSKIQEIFQRNNNSYIIISLALAAHLVSVSFVPIDSYASTFTIQQISDSPKDVTSQNPEYSSSEECMSDFPVPDIVGVAYTSNGETLNNTIWLRNHFRDPSKIDNYANVTIYHIDETNETQINSLKNPHILVNENGINASMVDKGIVTSSSSRNSTLYNYTTNDGSLMIIEVNSPKVYVITFDTTKELFNFYWPKAKKIFDSLANATTEIKMTDILYQPYWVETKERPSYAIAQLIPNTPKWLSIKYGTTIQVLPPRYNLPTTDYLLSLSWDWEHKNWTSKLEQISAYKREPIEQKIEQQEKLMKAIPIFNPDFSNTYGNGSHVDLSVNLKSIGSPDNYVVSTSVYSQFLRDDGSTSLYCNLGDNTSWIPLPSPKIDISVSPNSFTLTPGEKKPVELFLNSSSGIRSKISFDSITESGLSLYYNPNELSMPPFGKSSTILYISAPNDMLKNRNGSNELALPIVGYVDFPVDNSSSILYKTIQTEKLSSRAFADITLLTQEQQFMQQLNEAFNNVSTSMKELSSVVVAIVAIVTPLAAVFGRRFVSKKVPVAKDAIYYAAGVTTLIAGILHIIITPILRLFNEHIAIFFLLSGIFQLFLIVTLVKEWKKFYYIGTAGTIMIIIIGILSPVNESNASIGIWILIQVFQVAFVILTIILMAKKTRNPRAPFP